MTVQHKTRSARRILIAGLLLVCTACVTKANPGVAIRDVQADVAFGAAPANAPGASTAEPTFEPLGGTDSRFDPKAERLRRLSGPAPRRACPEAPLTAAPEEEASLNAQGTPAQGTYRFKRAGERSLSAPPVKLPISGFENRLVQGVSRTNADDFIYEMAQPEMTSDDIVVTFYQVRTNARSERVVASGTDAEVRAGEPDRGVAISRIERRHAKTGQLISAFDPEPAVLILPLPVVPGEEFQGTGVDPRGGANSQMQFSGKVVGRQRVDACGELVDGWLVDGSRTFGDAPQNYDVIIATQMGGLLIEERFTTSTSQPMQQTINAQISLGQRKPDAPK